MKLTKKSTYITIAIFLGLSSIILWSSYTSNPTYIAQRYFKSCHSELLEKQEICWTRAMKNAASRESLETVLAIFKSIGESRDIECHSIAHLTGNIAFGYLNEEPTDLFAPSLRNTLNSCGWGFWHGFMGAYVAHYNEPAKLNAVCAKFAQNSVDPSDCYHGIGLGAVGDPPPKDHWGNPDLVANMATAFCNTVTHDQSFEHACYEGVYHQIIDYMFHESFGLVPPHANDPFAFCFEQPDKFKKACFMQMAPRINSIIHLTVLPTLPSFKSLTRLEYFEEIAIGLTAGATNTSGTDDKLSDIFLTCERMTQNRKSCIVGIISGALGKGDADTKPVLLTQWCSEISKDEQEKQFCVGELSSQAPQKEI